MQLHFKSHFFLATNGFWVFKQTKKELILKSLIFVIFLSLYPQNRCLLWLKIPVVGNFFFGHLLFLQIRYVNWPIENTHCIHLCRGFNSYLYCHVFLQSVILVIMDTTAMRLVVIAWIYPNALL